MCTVLLRFTPDGRWPLLVGAVRDEFADRAWDPPAAHWPELDPRFLGGRDRQAGGTWLALDPGPERPAVAAVLNGARRPAPAAGARPTRGRLALDALRRGDGPTADEVVDHDGFHLLLATVDRAELWSWDGSAFEHRSLPSGDHVIVNLGVDTDDDPLVPHFAPLLAGTPTPPLGADESPTDAWGRWVELLAGDGLAPDDPRALLVRREIDGRSYASTSAALVALSPAGVRYDFTPEPTDRSAWRPVLPVTTGP